MKRLAFFICLLLSMSATGQKAAAFDQLTKEFEDFYFITLKKQDNFFEALLDPSSFILRINNPSFRGAKKDLSIRYPEKDNEALVKLLADSMIRTAGMKLLWKGLEPDKEKFEKVLKDYVDKTCACATVKLKEEKESELPNVMKNCEIELLKDDQFRNRMFVNTLTLTPSEKAKLQEYSAKFNYAYCKAWNNYFNNAIIDLVYGNYVSDLRRMVYDIDEEILSLYKRKKTDSLLNVFPEYKKHTADFDKVISMKAQLRSSFSNQETEGVVTRVTRTYISTQKQKRLLAQIIYEVELKDDVVRMKSFRFIPADKIKDKDKLLEELNTIPPPPPDEEINSY